MDNTELNIGAEGLDTGAIVKSIRQSVDEKMKNGFYNDPAISRAERANIANITSDDEFLALFLDNLRDTAFVDINDFEITERRKTMAGALVMFKKAIWKMLKFYTYRLWSQQNQVNGIMLAAMEGMHSTFRRRISELEEKVEKLEKGTPKQ